MFTTKNLIHNIKEVPVPWVFEHFCKLKEKLSGQDIKIKSVFNPTERTPSMCIYVDGTSSAYKFKDFSTGKGGDHITLVKEITGLGFHKACESVVEAYNDYVLHNNGGYDVKDFKKAAKYSVKSMCFRGWAQHDAKFWTQYHIGSTLLNEYTIRPLEYYTLEKEEDEIKSLTIHGLYIYGYFKKDGTLYKIYQPKTKDKKFLKIKDYVQGSEQIKGCDYLVITSSLKDIMSLRSLKLQNIDFIAPDSENSIIKKELMELYIKTYKKIVLLFDNDDAGIKAMKRYQELHPSLEALVLPMSKDPSDSIRDFGLKEVRNRLVPLLNKKIA
jgi:hypothetical protein